MIEFEKIKFKNFMSYGSAGAEFDLNKYQMTAILGENGAGKSSYIDAICYALYGKSFKYTPKSKIVNSINGKNMLVELDFKTNGVSYKVRRGMKPNIFEIYEGGKLITQESTTKNYQEILENEILKINMKNFTQTVLIGSSSFVPFMELSALDRRSVVENILGLEVITKMNDILKVKVSTTNQDYNQISAIINNIKVKLDSELNQVKLLSSIRKTNQEKVQKTIDDNKASIAESQKAVEECFKELERLTPFEEKYEKLKAYRTNVTKELSSISSLMKKAKKDLNFLDSHDNCPMCHQEIGTEHKEKLGTSLNSEISEYTTKAKDIEEKLQKLDDMESKLDKVLEKKAEINRTMAFHNTKISSWNSENERLIKESEETHTKDSIEEHKKKIVELSEDAKIKIEKKRDLVNQMHLMEYSESILKDSGIKSSIIEQYLPLINHYINKYLEKTDLYVKFTFDNQFNETIKARDRDEYTYQNLSQGEKRRLDMSILLTWRHISEMVCQTNCNLLVIDEILDSSLDQNGADSVLGMLRDMKNLNIFIISHRQDIQDSRVDKYLKIKKINQFSVVES
jgi:DNA repair exonuclease SbcCD ATPase subunit